MRALIQRVKRASVTIGGELYSSIGAGMLVFVGVTKEDQKENAEKLAQKLLNLRIFEDENGKMNRSIVDEGLEFLVVSQFTLCGDCKKGTRPSFDAAAAPDKAVGLYEYCVECLCASGLKVETGKFQAMMDVELINDGPVTFLIDK
ncbi:MAG: D-aminoacyl-tRNA deacylase [Fusobacterium sp.]|nr:D-aminoacyl-tRNA deacylase [Fusobacterium sp.]